MSCLVIIVSIVIYCSTRGISLMGICRHVKTNDELLLAFGCCCNTCYRFIHLCLALICIFISFVITIFTDNAANTHTSQIIELISVAMMFMSLIILCDQLIAWSLGELFFINTNYSLKCWLLWQVIVIGSISMSKFIVICPVTIIGCRDFDSWNKISGTYYSLVIVFIINVFYKLIFDYDMRPSAYEQLSSNKNGNMNDYGDKMQNKITDHNGLAQSPGPPANMNILDSVSLKNSTKRVLSFILRHISTILIIGNASFTVVSTMSLYFVIQHHINHLENKDPFVKYNQQLTDHPTPPSFSPIPVAHPTRPTLPPTTRKPTAYPIENASHVRYIQRPYNTLQQLEFEQMFCWIACLIGISVILVVLHSRARCPGMFFLLYVYLQSWMTNFISSYSWYYQFQLRQFTQVHVHVSNV